MKIDDRQISSLTHVMTETLNLGMLCEVCVGD